MVSKNARKRLAEKQKRAVDRATKAEIDRKIGPLGSEQRLKSLKKLHVKGRVTEHGPIGKARRDLERELYLARIQIFLTHPDLPDVSDEEEDQMEDEHPERSLPRDGPGRSGARDGPGRCAQIQAEQPQVSRKRSEPQDAPGRCAQRPRARTNQEIRRTRYANLPGARIRRSANTRVSGVRITGLVTGNLRANPLFHTNPVTHDDVIQLHPDPEDQIFEI